MFWWVRPPKLSHAQELRVHKMHKFRSNYQFSTLLVRLEIRWTFDPTISPVEPPEEVVLFMFSLMEVLIRIYKQSPATVVPNDVISMAPTSPRKLVPVAVEEQKEYPGHTTLYVVLACILAASGGLLFGYDIGISGGVEAMHDFQVKFFPQIASKLQHYDKETDYCKYSNHWLQTCTSSMYLTALVSTFLASWITDKHGRKLTMFLGGVISLVGAGLTTGAQNLAMIVLGRALMGIAIGFANQVVPLYSSEMAPARWRGGLNILFQLGITIGIFAANMVNYMANQWLTDGWRISFAVAVLPATLLTMGGWLLPDTPLSLIRRNCPAHALAVLQKIRGIKQVLAEFQDIQDTVQSEAECVERQNPFRTILRRDNRPQLVISALLQFFQQFTGINAVMFYAPVLFHTLGYGSEAALYSALITGAVNLVATIVSIFAVDKLGRRFFLLAGGLQMFLCQVGIGIFLAINKHGEKNVNLSHPQAIVVVIFICLYVSAFAWSWGPLSWLIPSEILTFDTRSAGQSIVVSVNMFFTFLVAQFFLSSLCVMKWGIFLFFGAWVAIMQVFVLLFVPETKGMHIAFMDLVWKQHWYWKRFMRPAAATKPNQVRVRK